MSTITQTAMQALLELGQSVWLDYLRRGMLRSGELQGAHRRRTPRHDLEPDDLRARHRRQHRLRRRAAHAGRSPRRATCEVFEQLAVEDVRAGRRSLPAGVRRDRGRDGFVSLEVSPTLARDTEGTIAEARRLWAEVDRPNVMIKVPGTKEGWPAVRAPAQRRDQRQHHPAVLAGALPPGRRCVPPGARGPRCARASRSIAWRRSPRSS